MTPQEKARLLAAFTRGDAYVDALADSLYLVKLRVYADTLSALLDELGYENEGITLSPDIQEALDDEAFDHAERIAATYNRDLARFADSIAGLDYAHAVERVVEWSRQRDENRAQLIGITEAYPPAADATVAFFLDNGVETTFNFGAHVDDAPAECPICMTLEARNPHSMDKMLRVGDPHPQCRQAWRPNVDPDELPDEVVAGLGTVAGIVGSESLITRAGSRDEAVRIAQEP